MQMPEFSSEMLAIWQELREIVAAGDHEFWEDEGGKKGRYYDLDVRLTNLLLGLGPHQWSPIRALNPLPPLHDDEAWGRVRERWRRESRIKAHRLAKALDAALAAQRRKARRRKSATPARPCDAEPL